MDASELALKMLEWENKRRELDILENQIKAAVIDLGQSQTVGNVKAGYRKGSRKYDYEAEAKALDPEPELIERHTTPKVDWKMVCLALGLTNAEMIPIDTTEPSVSIKLME